jgi:hypothetical protein
MAQLWLSKADTFDPTGPHTQAAIDTASFILYKLTGEKYPGVQTSTDAYSSQSIDQLIQLQTQIHIQGHMPIVSAGNIFNMPIAAAGVRNLRLRSSPVHSVISVIRDGELVDPESYTLRNNAYLVQTNGAPWLFGVTDTLITYVHGTPVPRAGKSCAIRLANELIHAAKDDGLCTLPERVQSVTRQGLSFAVLDPQDFIQHGKVGIPQIDYFIQAANPGKARKKARVYSVDRPRGERIN